MKLTPRCKTIGLTGGIASGKSAVSQFFEECGCVVIDADIVAREVVLPNTNGLNQLVEEFGFDILKSNNQLDRAKLRQIVFNDEDKLKTLNAILHPLIQTTIHQRVIEIENSFCIIVIPLLCESRDYAWLDRVLVVDVKPETQLNRLLKRDSINIELAHKMMSSQCTREQRLKIADDVVNNEQTLKELKKQVNLLNCLYKKL